MSEPQQATGKCIRCAQGNPRFETRDIQGGDQQVKRSRPRPSPPDSGLSVAFQRLTTQKTELQVENRVLREQLATSGQRLADPQLHGNILSLQNQLMEAKGIVTQQQNQLEQLETCSAQLSAARADVARQGTRIKQLERSGASLRAERENFQKQLEAAQADVAHQDYRIKQLETEGAQLKAEKMGLQNELSLTESLAASRGERVGKLLRENKKGQNRIVELEKEVSESRQASETFRVEQRQLEHSSANLKNQLDAALRTAIAHEATARSLNYQLLQQQGDNSMLRNQIANLQAPKTNLLRSISSLQHAVPQPVDDDTFSPMLF